MYVKKDLTLAPLLESQVEEDPPFVGEKGGSNEPVQKRVVDKTFYGRVKLSGDRSVIEEEDHRYLS